MTSSANRTLMTPDENSQVSAGGAMKGIGDSLKAQMDAIGKKRRIEDALDPANLDEALRVISAERPELNPEQIERLKSKYVQKLTEQHAAISTSLAEIENKGVSQLPMVEPDQEQRQKILKGKAWVDESQKIADIVAGIEVAPREAVGPPSKDNPEEMDVFRRAIHNLSRPLTGMSTALASLIDPRKESVPLGKKVTQGFMQGLYADTHSFRGSMDEVLTFRDNQIKKKAIDQALQEHVANPEAEKLSASELARKIIERGRGIAEEERGKDWLPTSYPNATRALTEVLVPSPLDPLAVGMRAAGGALAASKAGRAAGKAIESKVPGRWAPELTPLRYGDEAAQDAAAITERGLMEAQRQWLHREDAQAHILGRLAEGDAAVIREVPFGAPIGKQIKDPNTGQVYVNVAADQRFSKATDPVRIAGGGGQLTTMRKEIWVPKEISKQLLNLESAGIDVPKAATGYDKFMNATIRPAQKAWRTNVTVLGGPRYYVFNAMTAVGLPVAQLGWKATNPAIQAGSFAASLAEAGLGSKAAAEGMYRTLPSGQRLSYAEGAKLLDQAGLLKQGSIKLHADDEFTGILGQLDRKMDAAIEAGPGRLNNAIDNHQKITTFMSVLKDTTPQGIAKALQTTARIAGDYRRLSPVEKRYISDVFAFYGWSRYIIPAMIKAVATHPEMATRFESVRQNLEGRWGKYAPVNADAIPKGSRGITFTAPLKSQPPAIQETAGKGQAPDQTLEFALGYMETPYTAGLSTLASLGYDINDPGIISMVGPATEAILMMAAKQDLKTGEDIAERFPIPRPGEENLTQYKQRFNASAAGKIYKNARSAPLAPWVDLYDAFTADADDPTAALDLYRQYAISRRWLGFETLAMKAAGKKPTTRGGMFDPETGTPGVSVRLVRPYGSASRESQETIEYLEAREKSLLGK